MSLKNCWPSLNDLSLTLFPHRNSLCFPEANRECLESDLVDTVIMTPIAFTLPDWIHEGYIRDDVARNHEERYPSSRCLQTLVPPCLGDRTYTELHTTKGDRIIAIGTVIWIGVLPHVLSQSGSLYWKLATSLMLLETPEQTRQRIHAFLGSLHGHRIVGVSTIVRCSGHVATALVAYVFDDNMLSPWTVEGLLELDSDILASPFKEVVGSES
jgi:hypothetical protein